MLGGDHVSRSARDEGRLIGSYRIEQLIGTGGMGYVYRAVREDDGQVVALKVMKETLARDSNARRRFLHEARAASEVHHKHLLGVIEAGTADDRPYLVMPLVSGRTVKQRIEADGPLPIADTVRMAAQVGAGLDALHTHGLVHRDVTASNIIFEPDGSAAVMDFGLAKGEGYTALTKPGQLMGTLDYIAPELIRGQPASASSDLYALGCVVFECLAGHAPFSDRGLLEAGMAHLNERPADPCAGRADAPPGFGDVVLEALAKDPSQRPPTATAYARLLDMATRTPARR